jgi:hypothetical protein
MSLLLAGSFDVLVDGIDAEGWFAEIAAFSDLNLYQFWNSGKSVSRMLLRRRGEVVAAAEVRLLTLPVVRGGIAYVFWGPLWKRVGQRPDPQVFGQAIRALVQEYVVRRGMILWVNPKLIVERDPECLELLQREGLTAVERRQEKQSLLVDLSPSLEEIRKDFDKKWRNCLSKAERTGLSIESGTGVDLFEQFMPLHDRMLSRKRVVAESDIRKYRRAQEALPEPLKMKVVLAKAADVPCAGAIYSSAGDSAVYLFGATDEAGMRTSASYLVHWTIIEQLKAGGVRYYDLNGINPETNPGTYHFKKGLAGKRTPEVTFFRQFQAFAPSPANQCLMLMGKLRQAVHGRG